jgi:hypothetical protein
MLRELNFHKSKLNLMNKRKCLKFYLAKEEIQMKENKIMISQLSLLLHLS